ncbi:MAG: hypothetical protein PHP62_04780 [Candidatus Moranbacteria bacterium]|nr:hypothetical protein [Candidatus Moranbacteria bacterium]
MDSLLTSADCQIIFKTADSSISKYYLDEDCRDAFQNTGDMVIKHFSEINMEHGEKFNEEEFKDYISHFCVQY